MKPLEDKRKAMSKKNGCKLEAERKQSEGKVETECKQTAYKSLEIKDDSSLSKVKESKVSSSKEDDVVAAIELPSLSTERHLVFPLKASFALWSSE